MDAGNFDKITRMLATGGSRRDALRHLLGGAAGGALALLGGAAVAKTQKVTICHCPPGNPDNCHTITVGSKAAQKHLSQHDGDSLGPCDDGGGGGGGCTPPCGASE